MGERGHVLLADDNRLVVKVTSSILEKAGYKVDVAWDGIEAAIKAFSLLPDLMILDVEMPKIKGYQVCRLLKEDQLTSWMPVIMLTGREHQSDMFWGLKTGADAYITKGFKPEHLLDKVNELLSRAGEYEEAREMSRKRKKNVTEDYVIDKITDLLDRKLYETTILNDIASLSGSLQDFSETVNSVFEILENLFSYSAGSLLFLAEQELYIYVNRPLTTDALEDMAQETVKAATGYAWKANDPSLIEKVVIGEEKITEAPGEKQPAPAYAHIPLTAHKTVIGVLVVAGPSTPAFRRDAPTILNMVSNELTMILDNARLYEGAKRMAITDGLTKIYNHRFFQELFEKEFKRASRYGTSFSLIMLDIDYFKRLNDTYGHLFGDEILKEMANLVKGCLRTMDILARYGGEEFAILLPETDLEDAVFTADRIRMAVENHDFPHSRGKPVKVTVSQGVTSFPSPGIQKRSDIVAKADAALYEAKEAGRNRVRQRV
ncbi:MAG: diguanylate cyclase [Actinomycetota bacterium]|nr:diguanylate cyclase [Actinomycetota bacterium]MDD5666739.1 diguanylate cyclase [Actinomycetota bacterium]